MKKLSVVKVGGKIVENEDSLLRFLKEFSRIEGYKILVHGGGRSATALSERLGVESQIVDGRRITDKATLEIVTMVYGGLVNKNIVAQLQALDVNSLGLMGADLNIILAEKRKVQDIDYGYVGDIVSVNNRVFIELLEKGIVPVLAPLTHNKSGDILNTNADTIAAEVGQSLSSDYEVTLIYCFEKKGVLLDEEDENSVIPVLDRKYFDELVSLGVVKEGMLPKLQNAFSSIEKGVNKVIIREALSVSKESEGTVIK
ncbi:MAG: acetylglutamate kinase [Dysgonomonas sp.]